MTPRQQIKQEIRHLTRPVGVALALTVTAIIGWGAAMRVIQSHLKEVQRVHSTG